MKKTLPFLILIFFFLVATPAAYACKTNTDCPGNAACNVSTGICATPSDTAGTGTGFVASPTTNNAPVTNATPAATTPASTGSNFVPLTNIPGLISTNGITNAQGLTAFFNDLYKICIGVAATLAVLQIIRAGIMYMGGDSITETKDARALIATAIGGLVLVLAPVIVFSIINPKILSLQVGFSSLAPNTAANSDQPASAPAATCPSADTSTYNGFKFMSVPTGKSCSDVLGTAWNNVQEPACCPGTATIGQVCCGQFIKPPQPTLATPIVNFTFDIIAQKKGQKCVYLYTGNNYRSVQECETPFNQDISSLQSIQAAYGVIKICGNTEATPDQGAQTLQALSLPTCTN